MIPFVVNKNIFCIFYSDLYLIYFLFLLYFLAIIFSWIEQLISLETLLPGQIVSALEMNLTQKSSVPSSTGERAKRILLSFKEKKKGNQKECY